MIYKGKYYPKKPKIEVKCLNCKKIFKVYPYRLRLGEAKYCSIQCRIKSKLWIDKMKEVSQKLRGKEKVKRVCLHCKKIYYIFPNLVKVNKFCSRKCHANYYFVGWNEGKTKKDYPQLSNSGVKKGNIPWNKGKGSGKRKYKYTIGFCKSLKELIRDKFDRRCQVCGCPEIECRQKLSIHHIDYNPKNLRIDNLIPVCRSCHSKTNGGSENRKYWNNYFKNKMETIQCQKKDFVLVKNVKQQ
jgi:hypothetical protein